MVPTHELNVFRDETKPTGGWRRERRVVLTCEASCERTVTIFVPYDEGDEEPAAIVAEMIEAAKTTHRAAHRPPADEAASASATSVDG